MKSTALFLAAILCLAQTARDDYRQAYRAWLDTDPKLEREAAAGGAAIAQRADRMAAVAAQCATALKVWLEGVAQDQEQQVASLRSSARNPEPPFTSTSADTQFVTAETASVTRTMGAFARSPDKGLQQLRESLARDRAALDALGVAIAERHKAAELADTAAQTMEEVRTKALDPSQALLDGARNAAAETTREAAAWAEYYRKIGEGAEGVATPITVAPPGVPPAVLNNPIPAPPSITPVPLVRYIGAWSYPQTNGLYHGAQPEVVEVLVTEESGQLKGTISGRFKLPPGSSGDPIVRFDFSGPLQPTRNQVLNLVSSDGTKGTIELIPGPAFNLLEVNFHTEPKPGKIHQADVVLLKK